MCQSPSFFLGSHTIFLEHCSLTKWAELTPPPSTSAHPTPSLPPPRSCDSNHDYEISWWRRRMSTKLVTHSTKWKDFLGNQCNVMNCDNTDRLTKQIITCCIHLLPGQAKVDDFDLISCLAHTENIFWLKQRCGRSVRAVLIMLDLFIFDVLRSLF